MPTKAKPTQPRQMTTRERQVMEGLAANKSQTQIAKEIGISRQRVFQIIEELRTRGVIG